MTPPQSVLEARVLALERRCRRQTLALAGLGATLLTACLAAAVSPGPDVVQAREFVLLGPDGKERGRWNADEEGTALSLQDAQGKAFVALATGKSPGVVPVILEDESEEPVLWAGLQSWTQEEDEEAAYICLGTTPEGMGLFLLHEESSVLLGASEEGTAMTLEGGKDAFGSLNLRTSAKGSSIDIGYDDERTAALEADGEGARLILSKDSHEVDESGQPIVELRATDDAGSIRLHDGDAVIFEEP